MNGSPSTCHQGLHKSVNNPFIRIRCADTGKHQRLAGQWPLRTGFAHLWMVFTDVTHLDTLTQRCHFVGQTCQYSAGSSFILVQSCVCKLLTLVVRNRQKSPENNTQATSKGKSGSTWKFLMRNLNLMWENGSNSGINLYRLLKRTIHRIQRTWPMCHTRRPTIVFFMIKVPKLWRNWKPTSLGRFMISLCVAEWRVRLLWSTGLVVVKLHFRIFHGN